MKHHFDLNLSLIYPESRPLARAFVYRKIEVIELVLKQLNP